MCDLKNALSKLTSCLLNNSLTNQLPVCQGQDYVSVLLEKCQWI